jgi:hypothetical protein
LLAHPFGYFQFASHDVQGTFHFSIALDIEKTVGKLVSVREPHARLRLGFLSRGRIAPAQSDHKLAWGHFERQFAVMRTDNQLGLWPDIKLAGNLR